MTSKDFIRIEQQNTDRIILYREGLFWKAYERSAFAVCTQIRAFKPTRRAIKALDGGDLISIGFPSSTEQRVLEGLTRMETEADRLVLTAPRPIAVPEFMAWKASVPLTIPKRRSVAVRQENPAPHTTTEPFEVEGSIVDARVPAAQEPDTLIGLPSSLPTTTPDSASATIRAVARRVEGFDLASSTPMECMLFISELKKMLAIPDDRGTI